MESVAILIVLFLMGIHEHLKRSHVCIHIQANHGAISICPEFWHPSQRPPPTKNRREKAKTKPKQKTKPKPKPKKKNSCLDVPADVAVMVGSLRDESYSSKFNTSEDLQGFLKLSDFNLFALSCLSAHR